MNEKYLDKNYGFILIIWDWIFGIFIEEEEMLDYGILKFVGFYNFIYLVFYEVIDIVKDLLIYWFFKVWYKIFFGSFNLILNKKVYVEVVGLFVIDFKEEKAIVKVKVKVEV